MAPGPDGFLMFFRSFWEVVKGDRVRLLEELYEGTIRLERINYSQVVLIPKRDLPSKIEDYIPIALLNIPFKIVSKYLANRLAPQLETLVKDY